MKKLPTHVYAIGIAGVGVSAVARYFLQRGVRVSGSDPRPSPLVDDLRRLGADIVNIPDATRVTGADFVVYSDDVPADQPERLAATRSGLVSRSFAEALGEIMAGNATRVAVAGTNGKSTTTAILGLLLTAAGQDPTVFVGSRVKEFSGNLRLGRGPVFVAEADEYRDHFLRLDPTIALITNIELDHVEYFKTTDRMERSYVEFVSRLPQPHPLIVNADDPTSERLWDGNRGTVRYGFSPEADVRIAEYATSAGHEEFALYEGATCLGKYVLKVPGRYNVMNAVGAMTMAHQLGVAWKDMIAPLAEFRGIWRRFEVIKPDGATLVVNDYAHHPTSVRATIEGARAFYPGRRLIAVFQPHHRHRLQALFTEFAAAFDQAHEVIITDVYAVPGRETDDPNMPTSKDLAAAVRAHRVATTYAASLTDVVNAITAIAKKGDVIVLMGAGDIWTLGEPLANAYA